MPLGKYASRKSLRPDRSRSKSIFSTGAAVNAEPRAHAEAVGKEVLDDLLLPEKGPVLEDLSVVPQTADPAVVILGDDTISSTDGLGDTAEEENASNPMDAWRDGPKEDCASIEADADAAEKILSLELEEPTRETDRGSPVSVTLTAEEPAGILSISEAKLNDTETANLSENVISISPLMNNDTANAEQAGQGGEKSHPTSTPAAEDAKHCMKAISFKAKIDHSSIRDVSDLGTIEGINVGSNTSESKDNLTPSKIVEEASIQLGHETPRNQGILESDRLNFGVEEQSPLQPDPKSNNLMGLFGSPKFSLRVPGSDLTVSGDAGTSISNGGQVDGHGKEETSKSYKSAQSKASDVFMETSPVAQRTRHSIRLSMEDLTPEEITEATAGFHDYTSMKHLGPTSEVPLDLSHVQGDEDDACQCPPRADSTAMIEKEETSEDPVEAPKGRTRSGARFSDDTNMLKEFLSRAQARKLAQPSNIPMSAPKTLDSPRSTPRKALAELDSNSPSTHKQRDIASRPGTPPGKGKLAAVDLDDLEEPVPEPTSCRRSTRTRSPAPSKTTLGAPSFIPVRRADGTDPVVLQKSAAQELAIVTRANTRRNKGQAKVPSLTLQSLPAEGSELAAVKNGNKDAKSVGWDDRLVYFHEATESTEVQEEKRPRVRRLRGLGGVNGTPAPKKMMADVNVSYGAPAPKRRSKIR